MIERTGVMPSIDRAPAMLWLRRMLNRVLTEPEPIELLERRYNYLPRRFRWRGSMRYIGEVVSVWDEANQQRPRRYFQVACRGEEYLLFQDLRLGMWYLQPSG